MAQVLESVAALLWPIMVGCLAIAICPAIKRLINQSNTIEIEVGDTRISVQRASDELSALIADLQDRVNTLESGEGSPREPSRPFIRSSRQKTILWVDDRPKANVFEQARLKEEGWAIVQAESTTSALNEILKNDRFDAIISDMARMEDGGRLNPTAGMDLIRKLPDRDTPIIIYGPARNLKPVQRELDDAPGVHYTTSPSELLGLLRVSNDRGPVI